MSFQIIGTGRAHPEFVLDNEMLSKVVDTNDEWIVTRTGINTRYVSTDETITELSVKAAKKALVKASLTGKDLDLILCSTMKGDYACPSLACLVQRDIGADCPAVDLNAACSGFMYALDQADAYISSGKAETILIIAAEMMTRHLDWTDRATCVLFGDGAGAVVVRKGDGLKSIIITAKGDDQLLVIGNTFCKSPYGRQIDIDPEFRMKGGEVYKFAVTSVLRDVKEVMKTAGVKTKDIKMMIPHQANLRVFQAAKEKLGFTDEQLAVGIDHYGNTSSASIPLMLDELIEAGKIKQGDLIVLTAFGGGLTTGACVMKV
ncbi:MAG TPA: beta-ketoacyl-ACP synthase III [Bacillota bacterium]|nr:beta-ketoacyl-ACP synthase III [Bacillota bacterium]